MEQYNYILSGFGYAAGKYEVTNQMLEEAVKNKMLDGFNSELISHSKNYQAFLKENPGTTPFDYFVGHKMGFYKRRHVTPWPPIKQNQDVAENSLDLLIEATEKALQKARLDAEEIDGWIVSTVSPQELAPGITATLKCYFTHPDNHKPAMTLTSGCAGFNIALRRSLDYFRSRPDVRNILIANTETMSHFLNHKRDFVFHATFGDAAAATVISRVEKQNGHEGVGAIINHHDLRMIDFVGVDKDWNLYMDGAAVKRRAVPDLVKSSREILEKQGWSINDVDLLVPHQTGNAILHSAAEELGLPRAKLYQKTQHEFGNISGTTIPMALAMLQEDNELRPGMKILCPTAGVGGEYGAWSYVVPQHDPFQHKKQPAPHPLIADKKILILFADNALGTKIARELKQTKANIVFHINHNNEYAKTIEQIADNHPNCSLIFQKTEYLHEVDRLMTLLQEEQWDYTMNLCLTSETIYGINDIHTALNQIQKPNDKLNRMLLKYTNMCMLHLGHPSEEAELTEPSPIGVAATSLHGLAGSMAGEAISNGVRTIWYIPAVHKSLTQYYAAKEKSAAMKGMRQSVQWDNTETLASKLIRSLYLLKVPHTKDQYEGPMTLRKDACAFRI